MSLAIQQVLAPATAHPIRPEINESQRHLNISVVFTSVESTLAALREAANLANCLGARITLLVPQPVPYALPLERPPVLLEFNEKRFRVIASESLVETSVRIFLCRDKVRTLISVLRPGSLVVVGGRKRRCWPTRDQKLARELRHVVTKSFLRKRSKSDAGSILRSYRLCFFACLLGLHEGLRQALGRTTWTTSLPELHRWACSFT